MGPGEVMAAVTDAGPLIHLGEVGCIPLLRIFDILHIPDAVWSETIEQNRVAQAEVAALNFRRHTLSKSEVARFTQENGFESLHGGERECLCLCRQIGVSILLTDDLAVRDAAKRLNTTPVGSLGIVVRAYRQGLVSLTEAEGHITDLYEMSSLFVTRAIIDLAIEQLYQHSR